MSGTGAHVEPTTSGGVILPTPVVHIAQNNNFFPGYDSFQTPFNDGGTGYINADGQTLYWMNTLVVTAQVDDSLLDPALDLEVQLHKWRGRASGRKTSGWSATADWDPFTGVVGAGSHMLSGKADGIQCARRTRVKVSSQSQRVAFNLGGFFRRGVSGYIDAATSSVGSPSTSTALEVLLALPISKTPSVSASTVKNTQPWSRRGITGYFAVSYSVADSSGRTDGRIFGPLSKVIAAGSATHPFLPNATVSATVGFPTADINPNYEPKVARMWWYERQSERQ